MTALQDFVQQESGWLSCASRANIRAGAAILALGCIDHIQAINLGDCAFGTFWFTCAALDAVVFIDNVSHCTFLSHEK